jgi:hypothetical protein
MSASPPKGFEVLSLRDEETIAIEGGELEWIPLRRRLGAGAFGTNAYRAAKAGDRVVEDHVESPGQEGATKELQRALEIDPTMRERALGEALLEPLHGLDAWESILSH